MTFSIRPAQGSDSAAAAGVVESVFNEYGFGWDAEGCQADLYDLQAHFLDRGDGFWLAEKPDGTLCGTAGMRMHAPPPGATGTVVWHQDEWRIAGACCTLVRLYLLADMRGSGCGAALLTAATAWAKGNGCRTLEIWSDKRFTRAHGLYRKLGAVEVGERTVYDPDESHELGMLLDLGTRTARPPNIRSSDKFIRPI